MHVSHGQIARAMQVLRDAQIAFGARNGGVGFGADGLAGAHHWIVARAMALSWMHEKKKPSVFTFVASFV